MEIPMATIGQAIELASGYGKLVVLNPAPAHEIPEAWLSKIDYLVPNEHEADLLGHVKDDFYFSIRRHLKKSLVITQGAKGVSFSEGKAIVFIPALKVQAVDTTAAGDAFIGGFSVAWQRIVPWRRPSNLLVRRQHLSNQRGCTNLPPLSKRS
ncbi:hypothetical protein N752_12755 [Desulforamulus aquiferis]|nr:hypothetical protein N752_12755 [Desulforamulus aquiferis]